MAITSTRGAAPAGTANDREVLRPLVAAVAELAADPRESWKKELWARHQALRGAPKIPVCVSYEGIPVQQWDLMFGAAHLRASSAAARAIELDLKRRLWMAQHVPDDHVVWPFVTVGAVSHEVRGWGVPIEWRQPDDPLGAKQMVAPFADGIDVSRLTEPVVAIDEVATTRRVEQASELVGGMLAVVVRYPHPGHSPFDTVVRLRGMEALLMDVLDQPAAVHAMMAFVTDAMLRQHRDREAHGWINTLPDPGGRYHAGDFMRVIASYLAEDRAARRPLLRDEWAYVSAQTSAGLGPAMFDEFVHQYHVRLAEPYTDGTVYYHGCECLDRKLDAIVRLPNLRRLHVSPWSSVACARAKTEGRVVLEVHAHPGKVLFGATPAEMRDELEGLVAAAEGAPLDLNLSDIHSLDGHPETLGVWARVAQDVAARRRRSG